MTVVGDEELDGPTDHTDAVTCEIDDRGGTLGHPGDEIEPTVVLGALDGGAVYEPIAEVHTSVCTQPIRREVSVVGGSIHRERSAAMIEANHIGRLDSLGGAHVDPLLAHDDAS